MAAAQIPIIEPGTQVIPRKIAVTRPAPQRSFGGFAWGVRFQLPNPAANDGFIIQQFVRVEVGRASGSGQDVVQTTQYWEAWKVNRGDRAISDPAGQMSLTQMLGLTRTSTDPAWHMQLNDLFLKSFWEGQQGDVRIAALAGFYEEPLPTDFSVNNAATNAHQLPSTTSRPTFWNDNGLFRALHFRFDYSVGVGSTASVLETLTVASASIMTGGGGAYTTHPQ